MLIMDDREPSITLAWLFILLFLPFLGVFFYLYTAGFLHAKTTVVDGTVSAVGTMNMDQRSLKLHKEMMVWVFDRAFARRVASAFGVDMTNCREVTLEDVLSVGRLKRFRDQAARLFSNVL